MHWEGMDVCCTNPGPDDAGDFDEGNAGWYFRSLHLEWPRHGLSPMLAAEQHLAQQSGVCPTAAVFERSGMFKLHRPKRLECQVAHPLVCNLQQAYRVIFEGSEAARAGPSGRLQVLGLSKAVRLQRRLATPFQEDVPPNPNNATSSEHGGMVV